MSPRIGPIEVLAELGVGAGSRVLHVRRAADGRDYALKVVSGRGRRGKFLRQLRNEYRVGRLLDHPALVRVECLEETTDWLWRPTGGRLLLELVPGRTLDLTPPLPPPALAAVLTRVAEGLGHMHEAGAVHADVKPNNLVLGPGGVKVIDFGLSRLRGERPGRLQGTPEYMAPEAAVTGVVDERADVFGFGATAYRLLTGAGVPTSPGGLPLGADLYRRRYCPAATARPDCPAALAEVIDACLEYEPARRPADMAVVRDTLAGG